MQNIEAHSEEKIPYQNTTIGNDDTTCRRSSHPFGPPCRLHPLIAGDTDDQEAKNQRFSNSNEEVKSADVVRHGGKVAGRGHAEKVNSDERPSPNSHDNAEKSE